MDMQHRSKMEKILKEYLSHITYIDDEFNISWEEIATEEVPDRPRRSEGYRQNITDQQEKRRDSKDSLRDFCVYMQQKYSDISLIPVPFSTDTPMNALQNYIDTAKLLVIDWKLDESASNTAVSVIKNANFRNLFKLCVIYTSDPPKAQDDFYSKMGYKEDVIKQGGNGDKQYSYVRDNANLFMICDKSKFSFDDIVREFADVFVKEIGYFSISFIQMFSNLEKQIPHYMNDFKEPFDSLLLLQTVSDEMPLIELNHVLDNMVIGTLRSDIHLDGAVLEGIYYQKIDDIKKLLNNDDFELRLWECLKRICGSIKGGEKAYNLLKKISIPEYKDFILNAIANAKQLYISIQNTGLKFTEKYLELKFEEEFAGINKLNQNEKKKVLEKYKKADRKEVKARVINAIPIFLLMMLEPDKEWNQTLRKLICMLKVYRYRNGERKLGDIFNGCYDMTDNGNMHLKSSDGKSCDWSLVHNKIFHGDVFFKYSEEEKRRVDECYLCIMPECHLLRPEKIDGKLQMIKGVVKEKKPHGRLRQSEHLTLLPNPVMNSKTLFITWQFHNVYSMDLEYLKKSEYSQLHREYRLGEDYIQQIMGEFISFYSKVGVEKIFAKDNVIFSELLANEIRRQ